MLWFVSFSISESPTWWMKLFTRQHVVCFAQAGNQVVVVEPTHSHVAITVAEADALDVADAHVENGREVWFISLDPASSRNISNAVPSCVSVVKSVLGLDAFCFTPEGLKKSLAKAGGRLYGGHCKEA